MNILHIYQFLDTTIYIKFTRSNKIVMNDKDLKGKLN